MRALPSATTICRVLIGLDRAGASGMLCVQGMGREAAILLDSGCVVGANVDRRVATARAQVLRGVQQMCDWEGIVLRLVHDRAAASWWRLQERFSARDLALCTMRGAVEALEVCAVRAELGDGVYHLTSGGEELLEKLVLRPEEQAALFWLRRGVPADELYGLPGCGLVGYRFLCALKLLRAAAPRAGGSYPLLLRKRREVRRHASAHALLDLPEGAGRNDARRALRKLVRDLHPDRFGDGSPAALRRASGEIVTALVDAEARIAAGGSK